MLFLIFFKIGDNNKKLFWILFDVLQLYGDDLWTNSMGGGISVTQSLLKS